MPTFIKSQQNPKYRIFNMAVNIDHVKSIDKSTNGFSYTIIFLFNERQSFEWTYRFSADRDAEYERLKLMLHARQVA